MLFVHLHNVNLIIWQKKQTNKQTDKFMYEKWATTY